jgi:hypothetical protein
MQITYPHHTSGLGIFAKSKQAATKSDWKEAEKIALEMCQWLDETNGNFNGQHSRAFAMAHAQVCEKKEPWQLFVVEKDLIAPKEIDPKSKQTLKNCFFEAQAIFNCEVLEAPAKVKKQTPQRKVGKPVDGKVEVSVEMVEREIDNVLDVPEGCMSFPHRSAKTMKRCHTVKVRYQYVRKVMGFINKIETFEGWVEGLKAHIIQHECDHFNGKNIFYNK